MSNDLITSALSPEVALAVVGSCVFVLLMVGSIFRQEAEFFECHALVRARSFQARLKWLCRNTLEFEHALKRLCSLVRSWRSIDPGRAQACDFRRLAHRWRTQR